MKGSRVKVSGYRKADGYIGIIAQQHNCRVITLDEHFKEIGKALGLELIEVSPFNPTPLRLATCGS